MSDSEEDYMSDKLLTTCEKQDIRPSLLYNKSQKRTHDLYKKQIEDKNKKPKTYREQEKETREKGLNTAISSDNIGFKLLQKMGYKQGKSLGKTEDSGIKEPVNVILKESASGLGREKHLDDVIKKKRILKQDNFETVEREYKAARQEKTQKSLLRRDYFKSQRICEDLDAREGIQEPMHPYFWTKETMTKLLEDSDESSDSEYEEEEITEDNLYKIINYLRDSYWYCMYCGIKATDQEDLDTNCPGAYRVDHSDDLD